MSCSRTPTALLLALALAACGDTPPASELLAAEASAPEPSAALVPGLASMVDVTASHSGGEHRFTLSRAEVPAGWTTFRFVNASSSDHFVLLYRAPEQAIAAAAASGESLVEHWHETVTVPFQEEFAPYVAGEVDYETFVGNLVGAISSSAPWFLDPGAAAAGGPGLTAAGGTSQTTVRLEPGTYILECYVKDRDEQFHSYNGMLEMLVVTDAPTCAREPEAAAEVVVSSAGGIEAPSSLRPGLQTIAIRFVDQKAYEHLQGHNAQLVRLASADPALLEELAAWMDWRAPGSLAWRAPEGAEFMGGSMEMGAGGTAYFTVRLTPGTYAWIAEVPDPAGRNMLKTFTVAAAGGRGR